MGEIAASRVPLFWSKVDKTDTCWLWTGHQAGGYGLFYVEGRRRGVAHRIAYELLVGPVPDGLVLDHLCRVKSCVNPAHLEPVTNKENILRGEAPSARFAVATHCIRGHEFDEANTHWLKSGAGRACRTCMKEKARRQRAAKRAAPA